VSLPPPTSHSTPPGAPGLAAESTGTAREITVALEGPKGLRKLGGGGAGERYVRLRGDELEFAHPAVLAQPFVLPAGLVSVAAIDRGLGTGEHGRFPVLHRMVNGKVIPREQGIEGWLWTSKHRSVFPVLSDRADDAPNLALLFVKPLEEQDVARWFRPEWVAALAERSPLGKPSILGLLLCTERVSEAESAFRAFGVLRDPTDREVPPTYRRHLPDDRPANPLLTAAGDDPRAATSVAPPGF
jgi:hypothetical protein